MALDYRTEYPGQVRTDDSGYPYGKPRNLAVEGDGTGTPWEERLVQDDFGFKQALLVEGRQTPSGNPDTAATSQYLTGLKAIVDRRSVTRPEKLRQWYPLGGVVQGRKFARLNRYGMTWATEAEAAYAYWDDGTMLGTPFSPAAGTFTSRCISASDLGVIVAGENSPNFTEGVWWAGIGDSNFAELTTANSSTWEFAAVNQDDQTLWIIDTSERCIEMQDAAGTFDQKPAGSSGSGGGNLILSSVGYQGLAVHGDIVAFATQAETIAYSLDRGETWNATAAFTGVDQIRSIYYSPEHEKWIVFGSDTTAHLWRVFTADSPDDTWTEIYTVSDADDNTTAFQCGWASVLQVTGDQAEQGPFAHFRSNASTVIVSFDLFATVYRVNTGDNVETDGASILADFAGVNPTRCWV